MTTNESYEEILKSLGHEGELPDRLQSTYLGAIAKGVGKVKEDVDILFKLSEGITHEFVEQTETGTNAAPTNAMYESILSADGKTEQATYNGYNLVDISEFVPSTCRGISFSTDGNYIVLNGTSDALCTYTLPSNIKGLTGNFAISLENDANSDVPSNTGVRIGASGTVSQTADFNTKNAVKVVSLADVEVDKVEVRIPSGVTFTNYKFKVQVEKGDTAHDYEPYCGGIPSPNPEYPQDVVGVEEINVSVVDEDGNTETRKIVPPSTLYKIDEYADKLNVADGVWEKHTLIEKPKNLKWNTGTERWAGELTNAPQVSNYPTIRSNMSIFSTSSVKYSRTCRTGNNELTNTFIYYGNGNDDVSNMLVLHPAKETTQPIAVADLEWLRNIDGTSADKHITITDQNGNDISWLCEYIVKLGQGVATNE